MNYLELIGRVLFGAIFLLGAPRHFTPEAISHAAELHVPLAQALVPASGVLMIVGALSVIVGYQTRFGALLLVAFLIPVTLLMHAFWDISDPVAARTQQVMFFKNISMLGGALLLAYHGAGPISVDGR